MDEKQKEFLALLTCGILEKYEGIDELLKSNNIPKSLVDKMEKAMDLIFEVNQSCFDKIPKYETK